MSIERKRILISVELFIPRKMTAKEARNEVRAIIRQDRDLDFGQVAVISVRPLKAKKKAADCAADARC